MLYTRKGDDGTSGLFGSKVRLRKDSAVFEALGTLDELNSLLGVCRAGAEGVRGTIDISEKIKEAQERLFTIQAELAGAEKSITRERVDELEKTIDHIETSIEKPQSFVIPGATALSALLDYARAVSRKTERVVIRANLTQAVSGSSLMYLNRLSSFLYALARYVAAKEGAKEISPSY